MSKADNVRSDIKLVCCSRKKGYPGWPHIDFDHEGMMNDYLARLKKALPNCDFTVAYCNNGEEAKKEFRDNDKYDGVVIFNASHGVGVANVFLDSGQPGVLVDELYAGSGDLVRYNTRVNKEKLPVAVVASSDFSDTIRAVKLLHVKKQLANSKIVLYKNFNPLTKEKEDFLKEALGTGSTWKRYLAGADGLKGTLGKLKNNFGVEVVLKTKEDMERYISQVDEDSAREVAGRWIKTAEGVVGISSKINWTFI
jgi:AAA+ ATPase superfamily predicted ATPase